ncbi:MAG: hypothetical protein ABIV50_00440 [Opitutus sp.]
MSSLPVVAEVNSKLHADIALIRLLRAGIRAEHLSAVFPRGHAPNTVCCWLNGFHGVPLTTAVPMAAAGVLGQLFRTVSTTEGFEAELDDLGLTPEMISRLTERIEDGRTLLCVHAHNDAEAAVAWHIFQHIAAEHIDSRADLAEREHQPREVAAHAGHLSEIAA